MTINTWNRLFHYLFATLLLASSLHAATPLEDFGYFYDDPAAAFTAAQPEDPAFRAEVAAVLAGFARREKPTPANAPYQEISTSPDAQKVVVTVHLIHDLLMFADDAINTHEDKAKEELRKTYNALIASIQINNIRIEDMEAEWQALTDLITLLNKRENLQAIISLNDIIKLQTDVNPKRWPHCNAPIVLLECDTMLTDPLLQMVFDLAIYQMQTYNPTIRPHPEASTDTTTIAVHNDLEAFVKILRLLADRIKSNADRAFVKPALENVARLAVHVAGGEAMLAEARRLCDTILSPPQHVYYPQLARRAPIR
ncbi:hypothetical protein EBZ39_12075 [bacterium]|nr:hypothetical protein [bacterium]